jgi:dipeptidyl aminopeptidase/acylaminoacyl peptidase
MQTRHAGWVAAGVSAVVLLAGCGGGDHGGPVDVALGGNSEAALQGKLAWGGVMPAESDYELFTREFGVPGFTRLTRNAGDDTDPSWSPDGTQMVFHGVRNGNEDLSKINADGSG